MKKIGIILSVFALIANSCTVVKNSAVWDKGVVLNGVKWATRNVDEPGTFASVPTDEGKFYQWNRNVGWSLLSKDGYTRNDISAFESYPNGHIWDYSSHENNIWERVNDPCPEGWRVPTREELESLLSVDNKWVTVGDVGGWEFGTNKKNNLSACRRSFKYAFG